MDELHRETRRVILEARNQLEALEAASGNTQLDPAASALVAASFRDNVQLLGRNTAALRAMLTTQSVSKREVWKARLRDLDDQAAELRAGDARCSMRFRSIEREQSMREELLQRRGGAVRRADGVAPGDTVLRMGAVEEGKSLQNSTNMVGSMMESGQQALQGLMEQRNRLRRAKTKMLDVLNQMGVDRRIIASIERREYSDTLLVYGLMAGILVLLGLAVVWKHHRKKVGVV